MSTPVIQFKAIEKVEKIFRILRTESHHGFPVVDYQLDEVRLFFIVLFQYISFENKNILDE